MRWWASSRWLWLLVVSGVIVVLVAGLWHDVLFGFPSLRGGPLQSVPLRSVVALLPAVLFIAMVELSSSDLERISRRGLQVRVLDVLAAVGLSLLLAAACMFVGWLAAPDVARNCVLLMGLALVGLALLPRGFAFLLPVGAMLVAMAFGKPFGASQPDAWAVLLLIDVNPPQVGVAVLVLLLGSGLFVCTARRGSLLQVKASKP